MKQAEVSDSNFEDVQRKPLPGFRLWLLQASASLHEWDNVKNYVSAFETKDY